MKLTAKQVECLSDACNGPINSFDYGSTTISTLRRLGLIEGKQNLITPAGLEELAKRAERKMA